VLKIPPDSVFELTVTPGASPFYEEDAIQASCIPSNVQATYSSEKLKPQFQRKSKKPY
jgi:hypothetical protein